MTMIGILSRRWTADIVLALEFRPRNFNDLLNGIEGISDRVLTQRLREMGESGLVLRMVTDRPYRVSYQLTPDGRRFIQPLHALAAVEERA